MSTERNVFRLHVNCDNAAFGEPLDLNSNMDPSAECCTELARILREAADRIEQGDLPAGYTSVRDSNGNAVGAYRLRPEQD